MKVEGSTALGPALCVAIGMAAGQPGCKILLCTDGAANVGVGRAGSQGVGQFFVEMAQAARSKGTMVSVVTMEGEDCSMGSLGNLADISGGRVDVVDPTSLTTTVATLMASSLVGTQASCVLLAPRGFVFTAGPGQAAGGALPADARTGVMAVDLGNVMRETDLTCTFTATPEMRTRFKQQGQAEKVPFQLQLVYSRPNGEVRMCVITQALAVTNEREQVRVLK